MMLVAFGERLLLELQIGVCAALPLADVLLRGRDLHVQLVDLRHAGRVVGRVLQLMPVDSCSGSVAIAASSACICWTALF